MTLEDLLGEKYFPRELPPLFYTKTLVAKYTGIENSLNETSKKKATRCIDFSVAKVGLVRKTIKISSPMHQCDLSKIIVANWSDIESIF